MADKENTQWSNPDPIGFKSTDSPYRGTDDFSDSLQGYLRKISALPPLPEAEQKLLLAEIGNTLGELRRIFSNFPFIIRDTLDFLRLQISSQRSLRDFFVLSSCRDEKDAGNGKNTPSEKIITKWMTRCQRAMDDLASAIGNREAEEVVRKKRQRLSNAFCELEISGDRVEYYYEFLKNSRSGAGSGAMDPVPPPGPEEQSLLFEKLDEKWNDLMGLKDRMIESNLRLVIRIAQNYRHRGVPFNDLIQEGNLGLMRALIKFDARLGNRFSTYASWWIRHNIARSIAEQSRVIRIPMHMFATLNAINHAEELFVLEHDREPEPEELSALLNISIPRLNAIKKMARQTISLQSPVSGKGEGASLEDFIAETRNADPTAKYARQIAYAQLEKMLEKLSERDRRIITMRFGLSDQPRLTAMEVGRRMNLSRERIRQIELNVMNFLRHESKLHLDDCNQSE